MQIGNNIPVKLKTYNAEVKYDLIGGSIILYNHSDIISDDSYIFTGVSLEFGSKVKMVCDNLRGEFVDHLIKDGFIFVKSDVDLHKPVCIVSFKPKNEDNIVNNFYARFLEVKERDND